MNIFLVLLIRVPKLTKCFIMHFYNDLYSLTKTSRCFYQIGLKIEIKLLLFCKLPH